jgi:hypothetical protein
MNKLLSKMMSRVYRAPAGDDDGSGEGGEAVGTGNDARIAMLNSIGDNADRERGEDFADVNDDGSTSRFSAPDSLVDDAEAQAEADSQAAEEARLAAEQAAADDQPQRIMRKVNGQEIEITDDLIIKAQKIAAADQYLADASRIRNEAAKSHQAAAQASEVDDDLASVARAIQMGSEEEAVAALRKLIPKSPSPDDFVNKIDERLTFNAAYSTFCTKYEDIMGDPRLRKLAEDEDAALTAAGDTRSYAERFTAIGEGLRKWKQPAAVTVDLLAEKQARKAAAPSTPKSAGGKRADTIEEEKEESVSDTIAKIAQSRGGPQWMGGASR